MKPWMRIVLAITGAGTVLLAAFGVATYLNRDANRMYEAVDITSDDFHDDQRVDLGTMIPGQSVSKTLTVSSLIAEASDVSLSFAEANSGEGEKDVASFLKVSVKAGDKQSGDMLRTLVSEKREFTFTLEGNGKQEVLFTYTLLDRENVPLATELDFTLAIRATSQPLL